jgi:hypothetical protein
VVEYGNVVAALSALVLALGAATARIAALPVTKAPALATVTRSAAELGVPAAVARSAFTGAPYARNDLKALYAVAFVSQKGPKSTCTRDAAFGPPEIERLVEGMRTQEGLMERLRRAKIPVVVAAKALQRGSIAGCA